MVFWAGVLQMFEDVVYLLGLGIWQCCQNNSGTACPLRETDKEQSSS